MSHCSTSFLPCIVVSATWQAQSPVKEAISVANCVAIADWTRSNDEHAAAYSRAGLPQWAAECLSEPGQPSDFASQAAPVPAMAPRPAAVVQATVSDVMLTLPHDQDFGRAERFGELWSKAFGQVCCCIWLYCSLLVVPLPSGPLCILGPFAFWSLRLLGAFAFWVQARPCILAQTLSDIKKVFGLVCKLCLNLSTALRSAVMMHSPHCCTNRGRLVVP